MLKFSVVISTIDRANSLKTLLKALEHQSYQLFEVIAVVGPTNDNTLDTLKEYEGRICLIRCPVANLSMSRNLGLCAAAGDIVAYIDDDAIPCRNWLMQLNYIFTTHPHIAATGGSVYLIHPLQPMVQHNLGLFTFSGKQYDVRRSWLEHLPIEGEGEFWTMRMMGTNMAYRRDVLLSVGGFDELYEWVYDDIEIALRLSAAGFLVRPVREARVYHVPASNRNRKIYTFIVKWWINTKAATYLTTVYFLFFKSSFRNIKKYIQFIVGSHIKLYINLYKQKQISLSYLFGSMFYELQALTVGIYKALQKKLFRSIPTPIKGETRSFKQFMNQSSYTQPSIDPIKGSRADVCLVEQPLRIALLSYNYPPKRYDGVSISTNILAKGLFALGHTVHVVTHGEQQLIQYYDGAYVHFVPYELKRYAPLRHLPIIHHRLNYSHAVHEYLTRLVLNDGIQIVDTPLWLFDGFVTALSRALPVVVRPVTANKQISEIIGDRSYEQYLLGELERQLLLNATIIAANSNATKKALYDVYNLDKDSDIENYYFGIEPVAQEQTRPFPYHAPPETLTVLYVGRLEKRKGIQDLFAAIPLVLRQVRNVQFVIVGPDNSINDGFMNQTGMDYPTYFARHYPECRPYVRFLGEIVGDKLNALYQNCDLFVAPSLYESFGLIYIEAMNFAKPVIGCRAGGVPEIVNDGVTGRLVDPNSPKQLAEAIVSLLRSPRLLYEYGMAGRQRLLDYFTHIHMAQGLERIYRRVLGQMKTN